jgi:hypothetical protein
VEVRTRGHRERTTLNKTPARGGLAIASSGRMDVNQGSLLLRPVESVWPRSPHARGGAVLRAHAENAQQLRNRS